MGQSLRGVEEYRVHIRRVVAVRRVILLLRDFKLREVRVLMVIVNFVVREVEEEVRYRVLLRERVLMVVRVVR
jgi:hypothetical protein